MYGKTEYTYTELVFELHLIVCYSFTILVKWQPNPNRLAENIKNY